MDNIHCSTNAGYIQLDGTCLKEKVLAWRKGDINADMTERKPGRPRAIPESVIPRLLRLYHEGLGYRAVARELGKQGVYADWSTVRRIIKSRRSMDDTKNDF